MTFGLFHAFISFVSRDGEALIFVRPKFGMTGQDFLLKDRTIFGGRMSLPPNLDKGMGDFSRLFSSCGSSPWIKAQF